MKISKMDTFGIITMNQIKLNSKWFLFAYTLLQLKQLIIDWIMKIFSFHCNTMYVYHFRQKCPLQNMDLVWPPNAKKS